MATTNQIALYKIKQESDLRGKELSESIRKTDLSLAEQRRATDLTASLKSQELADKALQWRGELKEQRRSNKVKEAETSRANLMNEALKRQQNSETERSNRMSENQKWRAQVETERSNRVKEEQNAQSIAETQRSNKVREQQNQWYNTYSIGVANRNAATNEKNAAINLQKVNDYAYLTQQEIYNESDRINELIRSNKANETIKGNQLAEEQRHNQANEKAQAVTTATNAVTSVVRTATDATGSIFGWYKGNSPQPTLLGKAGNIDFSNGGTNYVKPSEQEWEEAREIEQSESAKRIAEAWRSSQRHRGS